MPLMFAERDPLAEKTFWNNHLTLQQRHGHGCSKTTLRRDPLKAQVIRTGTKLSRSQEGCKVLFPFGARPTPVENM
jgi:hypothetical protein